MAHTIDHKEEAYEIQREIEQRDNRHLNTGKNHLSYATKIVKSLLPDPKSFQDMSEYLLDMKTFHLFPKKYPHLCTSRLYYIHLCSSLEVL